MKNIHEAAFAFFSANLRRFMPSMDWTEHEDLYAQFLQYHKPCNKQHIPWSLHNLERIDRIGILVLFHLGNHEMLPIRLAESGLRFDILLSKAVHERHAKALTAHQEHFSALGLEVSYIFAEDPSVVFRIRNSIRQKRHVLIFADGNLGAPTGKYNLLEVPFMQASLWVKPGVAFLSHLFGMPVYPITDKTIQGHLHINVGEPIVPQVKEPREIYLDRCMKLLYTNLDKRLSADPMAWACWSELHLNGMLGPPKETSTEVTDTVSIQIGDNIYRFDRANYRIYRVKQ